MGAVGASPDAAVNLILVEDAPPRRLRMTRTWRDVGYTVDAADNGETALKMIISGRYQLVLTDWEMPGMDGVTLCRLIREANLPSIYILLLTSHGAVAQVVEGLHAGANDYIRKPAAE